MQGDQSLSQPYGITTLHPVHPLIAHHGTQGRFAWEEFIAAEIRNENTRLAYKAATKRFLDWVNQYERDISRVTPGMVAHYFDSLDLAVPSKKVQLAAVRGLFDVLVRRHVCLLNPALSVRLERHQVIEGKTPEITREQVRQLLTSIDESSVIGLRDKCIISMLLYTAARSGAIAKLRMDDLVTDAGQWSIRFNEKGGKQRVIPCRHDLWLLLDRYGGLISQNPKLPLFRSIERKTGMLSETGISGVDICRIVKGRLAKANLPTNISPHSFRSYVATTLASQEIPLEDIQRLLGHQDARTTALYDRRQRRVTRNIVERITV
jgi:integrase/recombinase XerD